MKNYIKFNKPASTILLLLVFILSSPLFQACEDDGSEGGTPVVEYIRVTDPDKSDSLVVRAFMGSTIAIVGENLQNVEEIWFNDQSAYLNTSYISSNSIIVTIPNIIPEEVTDSMILITGDGTKVYYPFGVDVPAPRVQSMLCEQVADGDTAVIKGNFFIDDPNTPLQVIFPGNLPGTVIEVSINEVSVAVPEGAGVGPVTVKSIYGSSRSSFYFRDDRNIFLDFDELTAAGGWRSGVIGNSDPDPISGNYVRFNGEMLGGAGALWDEDHFSFNLWPISNGRSDIPLYSGDISGAALKFECYVTEPWKSSALQMIFTPYELKDNNSYIADATVPRGLWMPWKESGSYKTDNWITVTIPLSEFIYTPVGGTCENPLTPEMLRGCTFFVWNGGLNGEDCTIHMCIDNVRIVPVK